MKRLRELDGSSALLERAQTLIASVDAIPDSSERMLRIRRALDAPRSALGFARGLPAWSAAGVLLMFGASVFAAVRLFGAMGSGSAPPMAAPRVEPSGSAAHVDGARGLAASDRAPSAVEPQAIAEVGDAQARPRSAHFAAPRERHVAGPVRARHATQLSARVSSRAHGLRRPAAGSPAGFAAWQAGDAGNALPPSSAALAASGNDAQSGDGPGSGAQSSVPATAESSALAKPEPAARESQRAPNHPQPAAADDEALAPRAPTSSDSELVHRALKALRRDHDPALAARLLDQQRAAVRGGPLAEEALALQIEATSALRQVRSRDFAREYMARYPNGRYRSVAEKVLQDPQL